MSRSASNLAERSARAAGEFVRTVAPRLRKLAALEAHLINHQSRHRFDDALVQLDFDKARRREPTLTKDRYLHERAPDSVLNRIRQRFGEDGLVLMSSPDPKEIFRVYAGMVSATRHRHYDADGGIRMTEVLARLDAGQQKALWDMIRKAGLPPPMGILPPRGAALTWKSHGAPIFWTNFGYAVLNRGREVMFRIGRFSEMVGEGKHQLSPKNLHKPAHGMLNHADCAMTMHDAVLASKGYTPIYGGVIRRDSGLAPKPATPGGRLHWELVLQLTHLTGDAGWLSVRGQDLSNKIAALRNRADFEQLVPKETGKNSNPHTDLSAEDCCKMLREDPDAPRVDYSSMEIEHSLGQRVGGIFDRVTKWLDVPGLAGPLNRMNGVFDPANLRAVSPMQHFMVDGFAAYYFKALRHGVFAPGSKRLGMVSGGKGKKPLVIPGRPYLQFDDPRKLDIISEIEIALEKRKARNQGDAPDEGLSALLKRLNGEARKVSYEDKAKAAIKRVADALGDVDRRLKAKEDVPLHEILEAIDHAGADRVKNAFVAMDGQVLRDVIAIAKDMPPARAAPPGYPRQQVTKFYESLAAAAKEYNIDPGVLNGKY